MVWESMSEWGFGMLLSMKLMRRIGGINTLLKLLSETD